MPKGYWIAHVTVHDPEGYKRYAAANGPPIARFGGRFLIRGGAHEVRSGPERQRHVVIEFPSYADAKACYDSPDYQAAARIRETASEADIVIVEGWDG